MPREQADIHNGKEFESGVKEIYFCILSYLYKFLYIIFSHLTDKIDQIVHIIWYCHKSQEVMDLSERKFSRNKFYILLVCAEVFSLIT
jgi:hypothetical protein